MTGRARSVSRALVRLVIATAALSFAFGALVTTAFAAEEYRVGGVWPEPTYHMNNATGVATDPSGNVYVADTDNNRVVKYGVNGGAWYWGGLGTGPAQFDHPGGVAVSPDGMYVYVADSGNHRIQKLTPNGVHVTSWGREGGPDFYGSGPKEFNSPKGICVDGSGYVYVADSGNARIQKFTSSGTFVKQWGSPGSEDFQFYDPRGIAVSPFGDLYVTDFHMTNSCVRQFDSEGNFIRRWGGWGIAPGQLKSPWGVAVDSAGEVYVAENLGHRIQVFSETGTFLRGWASLNMGDYGVLGGPALYHPAGVALLGTTEQALLVCDTKNSRLREFGLDGRVESVRGSWGVSPGRFDLASGVAVGADGSVAAVSYSRKSGTTYRFNHRAQLFSATGQLRSFTPTSGVAVAMEHNGSFDSATGCAVDRDGFVYVSEAGNNRIQKLAPETLGYVTKWGMAGTGNGYFNKPGGVAAGEVGAAIRIGVADSNNHRVQLFNSDGGYVTKWGALGSGDGQFSAPQGVAFAPDGTVYVADTGNNRVQYFDPSGAYLGKWGSLGSGPGQFSSPQGIAVDSAGQVWVSDTANHRIQKFTAEGTFLGQVGTQGADPGEFDRPRGISVSAAGVVYVADYENSRIQYLTPPTNVAISGVSDGAAYNHEVTPKIDYFGVDLVETGCELNSLPWTPSSLSADGDYTLRAWASDSEGYTAWRTVEFQIDTVEPATTSNAVFSYDNTATIVLNASDDRSGVNHTYLKLGSGAVKEETSVTVAKAGFHSLSFWSTDRAGNVETQQDWTFHVADTIPPSTAATVSASRVESAVVTFMATDAGSPVSATYYSIDGKPAAAGTSCLVTGFGAHTVSYWSVDSEGNVETPRSLSVTVLRAAVIASTRSASTVSYGGAVKLGATLKSSTGTSLANRTLVLERSYDNVSWQHVATLSSTTGAYSRSVNLYRRTWFRWRYAGDATHGACSSATSVLSRAYVSAPYAASTAKRYKAASMFGYLKPRHTAGLRDVKLYAYRYESGRWVLRASGVATLSDYNGYSRYVGSVIFDRIGRWRVRAYHSDADHAPSFSGYDYVTVN